MRNLVLTKTSELSIEDNYIRMVKKNKQLVSLLFDDRENERTSFELIQKVQANKQVIGVLVKDTDPVQYTGDKLLLIERLVTLKELENLEEPKKGLVKGNNYVWNIIKVPENFNRLDLLISYQQKFKDFNIRFVGGNLFNLEEINLGYIDDQYIQEYKLKRKSTLLFNLTYCVMSKVADAFPVTETEFLALLEEENKVKPKAKRKTSTKKSNSSKGKSKTVNKKGNITKPQAKNSLRDIFRKK